MFPAQVGIVSRIAQTCPVSGAGNVLTSAKCDVGADKVLKIYNLFSGDYNTDGTNDINISIDQVTNPSTGEPSSLFTA